MSIKFVMDSKKLEILKNKIKEHMKKPGPLMPTLHDAQNLFGCIPLELQIFIAEELNESVSKINGVVTFYSHFTLEPKGKNVIGVCLGTACYVKGSQIIIDEFKKLLQIGSNQTSDDGNFTLLETRCIGACGLAPVFTVNGEVYGTSTIKDVENVLQALK